MKQAPNEQLALQVIALVMAVGIGVWYGSQRSVPEWRVEEAIGVMEGRSETGRLVEAAAQEQVRARRRATRLAPGERIDPNTADADELQRLPRVGPSLAARIVEHRTAHGPFGSLADLQAVTGIGPALLDGIAPHVALPAAAPASPMPTAPAGSAVRQSAPPTAAAGPVDINTATAEQLERLPGIGPVLAARIVESRREHGPFRDTKDLERVSGIGPRLAGRLAPLVRTGP